MNRGDLILRAGTLLDAVYNGTMHPRYADQQWLRDTLGLIHQEEWKGILTTDPYYQIEDRVVVTDANGLIALSALDSGASDDRLHAFRVLDVADSAGVFDYVTTKDYPFAATEGTSRRIWLVRGRNIQVPAIRSGAVTVQVNQYPCRADLLSADTSDVGFVDGYELLLAYMLAARMGGKGAAEAGIADYLKSEAGEIRDLMLTDIRRVAARPSTIETGDDVTEWGGV